MSTAAPRVLQVSRSVIQGGFDYHTEIARGFEECGADVCTLFQRGQMSPQRRAVFPGTVICLDAERSRLYKKPAGLALALWKAANGRPRDLAVCHHLTPARAAQMLVRMGRIKKAALIVHDHDYFDPTDKHGRRRNRFLTRLMRYPWSIIGVSHAICHNVVTQVAAVTPERCRVIHNAIDTEGLERRQVSRTRARRTLGLTNDEFVFGTVGRLVEFKAHADLIDAFALISARLPKAKLIIIGRGPLESQLRQQVHCAGLDDRVVVHGFLDDAARYMTAFDTFVLPSRHEPFGLVLLEAMVSRLPIIASDSGAPKEILPERTVLFPTGDRQTLAELLVDAYRKEPSELRATGLAGFRRVSECFGLTQYRAAYAHLLDPTLTGDD